MKKYLIILLVLTLVFAMSSCGSLTSGNDGPNTNDPALPGDSGSGDTADRYPKITVAIAADPENLNPVIGNGNPRNMFYWEIYETLFDYDDQGNLVTSLGETISIKDETHYDVNIYDKIYDSEGNHITADDVIYSVNWLIDAGEAVKYEIFKDITKVDDYTVEFVWKNAPTAWNDLEMPLTRTYVFSQKAFESGNFATSPVGTGPYVVKSFTASSSLTLEANDDYWLLKNPDILDTHLDMHRANVQTIEFQIIPEAAQAQIALEQGNVDFANYINTIAAKEFREGGAYADKYTTWDIEQGDYYYVDCNAFDGKATADVNLRMAIWYALDSESITKAMGGNYAPMNTIGNSAYPDYNAAWDDEATYMNTYDLDLAKDYLAKSGYSGEKLVLLGQSDEVYQKAATMMQAQLGEAGIDVEIKTEALSLFNADNADPSKWDICISMIGGPSLVGSYNRMLGDSVTEYNGQKYTIFFGQDATLQSMYETAKADATHDDEHVKALIDYATSEMGYTYALAMVASSVICTNEITMLYAREGYTTFGPSEYSGYQAQHSANVKPLEVAMPEPSETPDNVYIFNNDDGTVWTLTLDGQDDWELVVSGPGGDATYTGDHAFPADEDNANLILTVPPNEGAPKDAAFYEDDGVCFWELLPNHGLVPTNYADYDSYKQAWIDAVNVFKFVQEGADGSETVWVLTLDGQDDWVLVVSGPDGDATYTGDHAFPADDNDANQILTVPPNEGMPPNQDFYEDDGVCFWTLDKTTGTMAPLNYAA